jgi:hypothetical protein
MQGLRDAEQRIVRHGVDLVERKDRLAPCILQAGDDSRYVLDLANVGAIRLARQGACLRRRVHEMDDHVGVARAAPGGAHHGPVELSSWREHAGRIDEHQLCGSTHGDPPQRRARGLHLLRDDGDF